MPPISKNLATYHSNDATLLTTLSKSHMLSHIFIFLKNASDKLPQFFYCYELALI